MNGTMRIQTASRRLRVLCTILMAATPVAIAFSWRFINQMPVSQLNLPVVPNPEHPGVVYFLGFLVSMIPGGVAMYALYQLRALFGLYAEGIIFTLANVRRYRRMGWAAIAYAAASFLSQPLHGLVLSWYNPPGQRLLVLSLNSNVVATIFVGAAVLTIAWVMEEGRRIDEEQALIV